MGTITQALIRETKRSDAIVLRGISTAAEGEIAKGVDILRLALRQNPDDVETMFVFKRILKPVQSAIDAGAAGEDH